jgi:hypothetical protein
MNDGLGRMLKGAAFMVPTVSTCLKRLGKTMKIFEHNSRPAGSE